MAKNRNPIETQARWLVDTTPALGQFYYLGGFLGGCLLGWVWIGGIFWGMVSEHAQPDEALLYQFIGAIIGGLAGWVSGLALGRPRVEQLKLQAEQARCQARVVEQNQAILDALKQQGAKDVEDRSRAVPRPVPRPGGVS